MSMPVLFTEISEDLGLSLVQVGTVWGITGLAGIFVVLIGGLLGDRFGVKLVITTACLLAGIAGASRGLSGNFATLMLTMFLFGLTSSVIPVNVHKNCGIWFSSRQLGLANGVVSMGMALGFTVGAMISATVLSPWLGGWKNVMFLYGAIAIVIGILWSLTRTHPDTAAQNSGQASTIPFRQSLSQVIRIREVWFLGLILLGQMSCVQGTLGYLPIYLREIGWTAAAADGSLAAFNGISMILLQALVCYRWPVAS
jgi:MFS family permease